MKRFWYWLWGLPCEHDWDERTVTRRVHMEYHAFEYFKYNPPLIREEMHYFCRKCTKQVVMKL